MEKEDFDGQGWAALSWGRSYVLFEGGFPDENVDAAFRRAYAPAQQKAIFATLKLMLFFNMLMNVFDHRGSRLLKM
jgi:hypothetical protein